MNLKFEKLYRFGDPYWFAGVYKISRYEYFNGERCKPYYQVYKLCSHSWGDYLDRSKQYNKKLTFKQAVALANEHAKQNEPDKRRLKQAQIARDSWCNNEPA